jgi:hypothetical protein
MKIISIRNILGVAIVGALLHFCWEIVNHKVGPSRHPIDIAVPPLGEVDEFSLRFCPTDTSSFHDVICNSVGTRGPVEEISWNSELTSIFGKPVREASYHFDRDGIVDGQCTRGHIDFQGGGCDSYSYLSIKEWMRSQQEKSYQARKVVLDTNGRIVSGVDRGTGLKFQCSYEGLPVLSTSTCNDGYYISTYEYRGDGRRLAYHRRRIPQSDDDPNRAVELDRAYSLDIDYQYVDDTRGNWQKITLTEKDGEGGVHVIHVERTVEYYSG